VQVEVDAAHDEEDGDQEAEHLGLALRLPWILRKTSIPGLP
jgi:hypothetical protein